MKRRVSILFALVAALGVFAAADEAFRVDMDPKSDIGGRVFVGNIPFVRGNRFTLHSPGWTDRYVRNINYAAHLKEEFRKTKTELFRRVTSTSSGIAVLDEYSIKCQGTAATVTINARMLKDVPAQVENVIGIDCWVLENTDYEVVTPDGKKLSGTIPEAESTDEETMLIPAFTRGVFRGRRQVTTVEVLSGPPLQLNDRRAVSPLSWGPSFLLWTKDAELARGRKEFRQVVKITFERAKNAAQPRASLSISDGYREILKCPAEAAPAFPLVPQPQQCRFTGNDYQVRPGDRLIVASASEKLLRHARKFAAKWGLELATFAAPDARGIRVSYGNSPDDESYTISINADGATVKAKGERGAFYALQTLRGLERKGVFKGAEIADAPAFPKRAIHANADSDAKVFLGEMIEKVLAPLKINTIILECPYVFWDSTAGKHRTKGMPKADLPELLKIAEENYIKVHPLVPTYSHSEWFFWNGKDTELRENPKDARSYNSLDPRVYAKIAKVLDEVLEAFDHPEYFHISHDELHDHPTREAGKRLGVAKLFHDDVMWHYEFFRKRGVKLMMWHDMLVSRQENLDRPVANARGGTEKLRQKLPKDITVCMWDYYATKDGRYYQIDLLQKDGFPVWCAGWFFPMDLEKLTAYSHKKRVDGMIETTWHSKVGSGGLLQTEYVQLKAYIRAAALFWNPEYRSLPDPAKVYVDLMRPEPAPARRVYPIPVKCDTLLVDAGDAWEKLPETLRTCDNMTFKLAKQGGRPGAVMVTSPEAPEFPAKVRIPIREKYAKLHLLHTTLDKAARPDRRAVKLVLRYRDGSVAAVWPRNSIDINYGTPPVFRDNGEVVERVCEVSTPRAAYTFFMNHRNVFEWQNPQGQTRRIWYWTWDNPHPDREIDHLLVEAVPDGCAYALLAISAEK